MEWWQTIFDDTYLRIYDRAALDARSEAEVERWVHVMPAAPARLLDVACGHGRHAIRFAQRGYETTGLDYSEHFLEVARQDAQAVGAKATFIHGDMRSLPFEGEFDIVTNLFSAFGYFPEEEDNQRALDAMARALKPGGLLMIDTMHRDQLVRTFRERDWDATSDGLVVRNQRSFDALAGAVDEMRSWTEADGTQRQISFRLRIYTATELVAMLHAAGLTDIHAYNGDTMESFTHTARRLLMTARKKA